MTQEQKAKAYDEALKLAKEIKEKIMYSHLSTESCKAVSEYIDTIIPELADSKDEKTRREIVDFIRWAIDRGSITKEQREKSDTWFAYLKKQKENPKNADSISADCTSDVRCEDRWHKVADSMPDNGRLVLAKDCLGNVILARYDGENWEVNVYDNEDHYCHNSISKWCEIPSEKQEEPKPLPPFDEVSPEEKMNHPLYLEGFDTGREVQRVFDEQKPAEDNPFTPLEGIDAIKAKYYDDGFKNGFDEGVDSVKSAKWSEEDEKDAAHIIRILDDCYAYGKHDLSKTDHENLVNKLKSLRPSWKPSEEQMKALLNAEGFLRAGLQHDSAKTIAELYEQLKKL